MKRCQFRLQKWVTFFAVVVWIIPLACLADEPPPSDAEKMQPDSKPVEAKTFDLNVVNIFDPTEEGDRFKQYYTKSARRGTAVYTSTERTEGVKYPKFRSDAPLFGTLKLGRNLFYPESTIPIAVAVDESGGTGTGYDLFYVDRNGNQDLTDDEPLAEQPFDSEEVKKNHQPPYIGEDTKAVICQPIRLSWPGSDLPSDYRVYPNVLVGTYTPEGAKEGETKRYVTLCFRYPTMRAGKIKIGRYGYQIAVITAGLLPDFRKCSCIKYTPSEEEGIPEMNWEGAECLNAVHQVDGHYYTMDLSPDGTKITIAPYEGKFGLLRMGLGKRSLEKSKSKDLLISGGLHGKPHCAAIGNYCAEEYDYTGVQEMKLPVGDYAPAYIWVHFGDIHLTISENYHSDGKRLSFPPSIFGIQIREDKPYTLDLSNTPTVLFTEPARQTTLTRGEPINIKPILIDPVLGIMFRGMVDTSEKIERTFKEGDERITRTENKEIEPFVEIRDSHGKIVSSGSAEYG